ncbi:MAG: membrane protein insertase YidC [Acidobacteria bacterium]|nr:membrane protein insertase YidC [Acidobacteriota bacterium]
MEDPNKQQNQSRFLLAAVLSLVVLSAWGYFFAPQKPADQAADANTNTAQANTAQSNTANSNTAPEVAKTPEKAETEAPPVTDDVPNKSITINTPLYQVKLDSKGAVATSWILKLNDSDNGDERKAVYAQGSTKEKEIPLELISPEGLKREPRQVPFLLETGDKDLDGFINGRNYTVSAGEDTVELKGEETKQIDFVLTKDDGTSVTKSFLFHANSYETDISVKITKAGKPVPDARLLIGPSIGDQHIERYNYYKVEPEGVAFIGGGAKREYAASIIESGKETGSVRLEGDLDWAGIGDTYFAMAAVPSRKTSGIEFRSQKFEVETAPYYDGIISWITRNQKKNAVKHLMTAYVPIVTDGSTTRVYTGTKDYFVLTHYNKSLSQKVGREIDIEDFINYGMLRFVTKPLSVPIMYCLRFLYGFTHNYGISIILFTLLFYSFLFPLRWYSSKSFKKAQKNAPKMKALQDKVKAMQKKGVPNDDPEMRKLQMDQLRMTKDSVPIGGCLPMLLQFPLIFALYITVSIYLGFRQEAFMWLPDLSSADPYHILEFAFAISMILSFKFSPTTPTVTPEQQMQQKMMTYIMPIMMLWVMWSAPSGLLLYWFTGNIFMFAQQMLINWMNKTDEPTDASGNALEGVAAAT